MFCISCSSSLKLLTISRIYKTLIRIAVQMRWYEYDDTFGWEMSESNLNSLRISCGSRVNFFTVDADLTAIHCASPSSIVVQILATVEYGPSSIIS